MEMEKKKHPDLWSHCSQAACLPAAVPTPISIWRHFSPYVPCLQLPPVDPTTSARFYKLSSYILYI